MQRSLLHFSPLPFAFAGLLLGATGQISTARGNPVLEETLVTAEFRDITLQEQPNSTTVVSAAAIQASAGQHLEDILNLAPNVNFSSGASRARFFQIRGVGERSQFQEPLNPSIAFIIDGIDFSGLGTVGTLFDVEQVEILRGPQGTLHGANALAGLINVRTGQPEAKPSLRLEASAAEYDPVSAGIVGTGPLVKDTLLYRVAVNTYRSNGYIENDYLDIDDSNNRDETTVRGKLRWLINESNTLDLSATYIDVDNGYDAFSLDNTRHTQSDQPGSDSQESGAARLQWHSALTHADMAVSASHARSESDYSYDEDWSYVGIAPGWEYSSFDQYLRDQDSNSAEIRFISNDSSRILDASTDWVAGLYYLGDRESLERRYTYLQQDFRSNYDTDTSAIFGQFNTQLGAQLTLITGLRYEHRRTRYDDNNGVDSSPSKGLWGGRLVVEYSPSGQHMLYGGVSRGYRANGVNATILASTDASMAPDIAAQLQRLQEFDEEYLYNYEAGYKGALLNGAMQARVAVFYMDRKDQQVKSSLIIPRSDGSTAFIDHTVNAASGNNYGTELEIEWLATTQLRLNASIGLLATKFDEYTNAAGDDLSGRDQAQAPGYQYALGAQFDFGHGFYARMDFEGKDKYYFSDRHEVTAPAVDLLHMRIGYDASHWSVALWARNLTDEDYFVRGFGGFGNDPRKQYAVEPYYQYGQPRLLGVSASYNF